MADVSPTRAQRVVGEDVLTQEGVACIRPSYEILVGRVVDHPIEFQASEVDEQIMPPGQRLDEVTHSYSFWRKAGTSCLACLFKWDELPLGATVSDICWSVVPAIVVLVDGCTRPVTASIL